MVLVGLLFPESVGRARRIERLHLPADLEAILGAAGHILAHVGNASFRVANVCMSRTPSPRGLTPSLCRRRRTSSLSVLIQKVKGSQKSRYSGRNTAIPPMVMVANPSSLCPQGSRTPPLSVPGAFRQRGL